jgi:hypothetical protein
MAGAYGFLGRRGALLDSFAPALLHDHEHDERGEPEVVSTERGKWELLAREMAGAIRDEQAARRALEDAQRRRDRAQSALWKELEKEQEPLGEQIWRAKQDPLSISVNRPPEPRVKRSCAFESCFYGARGLVHTHGVD